MRPPWRPETEAVVSEGSCSSQDPGPECVSDYGRACGTLVDWEWSRQVPPVMVPSIPMVQMAQDLCTLARLLLQARGPRQPQTPLRHRKKDSLIKNSWKRTSLEELQGHHLRSQGRVTPFTLLA